MESVVHGATDSLAAPAGFSSGNKERWELDHGSRREYPTLGGVLAPSQALNRLDIT
jgi:hypothetical protein